MSLAIHFALRSLLCSAVVTAGLFATGTASAGDCHVPRYYWKTVISHRYIDEPFTHWVTKYDHCGKAYRVQVTSYRTVKVPVESHVKVYY